MNVMSSFFPKIPLFFRFFGFNRIKITRSEYPSPVRAHGSAGLAMLTLFLIVYVEPPGLTKSHSAVL